MNHPLRCRYLTQVEHNGCWQTGCAIPCEGICRARYSPEQRSGVEALLSFFGPRVVDGWDPRRKPEPEALIGNWGWGCCERAEEERFRVLVNPGNSVAYAWVEWDSSKAPFPENAVFGDDSEWCRLMVATYYDSSDDSATDGTLGAQGGHSINSRKVPTNY